MEKKVLVIDVGGTFIKYGLIDEECQLTKTSKIKTPYESQEHFFKTLQNIYLSYRNENIQGIAMSVPGKIDIEKGVLLTSGALVFLEGLELAEKLSALCDHLPVSVENEMCIRDRLCALDVLIIMPFIKNYDKTLLAEEAKNEA